MSRSSPLTRMAFGSRSSAGRARRTARHDSPRRPRPFSQIDGRQVELVCPRVRRDRDREILDREPGRVEHRDVLRRRVVLRLRPRGHGRARSLGRASRLPRLDRRLSVSPPCEACSQSSQKSLARASSAVAISAFPGPSAPISETCCPSRSEPGVNRIALPGVTVITASASRASASVTTVARCFSATSAARAASRS